MASVSSTSSSTSTNSLTGLKGYGGLASGLDTDSLIYSMTLSTRTKIAKQKQNKQLLEWKQTAYRSVSSKLVEFSQKYTSYTSSTNLLSSKLFSSSKTAVSGTNSSKVSISGSSSTANGMSISSVEKLASDAKLTMNSTASTGALTSGAISTDTVDVNKLIGQSLTFQYGSESYTVYMQDKEGADYTSAEGIADSINAALKDISISGGGTLADKIQFGTTDGKDKITMTSNDKAGNTVQIKSGGTTALSALGLEAGKNIKNGETVTGTETITKENLTEHKKFEDMVKGKTMTFSYNGTSKTVTLMEDGFKSAATDTEGRLKELQENMQSQLDKEFGTNRVTVGVTAENGLSFKTTIPNEKDNDGNFKEDTSSVLKVTSASSGLLGSNGALKINSGDSNRLNTSAELAKSGLKNLASGSLDSYATNGELNLEINGTKITGLTTSSSISDIMTAVNNSDAKVSMSYLETSDKFVLTSTDGGAAGKIDFGTSANNFASVLFGTEKTDDNSKGYTITQGQDAIINVKYAGSDTPVTLQRGSNSFNLEGVSVTLNGTFDSKDNKADEVTFTSTVDTDKIYSAVESMVKDYNDMISYINKEVSTKPNRTYSPLTDEQKEEMTDNQITKWEEKAKEGLLFNDSDLSAMATSLRTVFTGALNASALEKLGINVSSDYSENGKISIDETKFKAALETNLDQIQELFTGTKDTSSTGKDGIMTRMKAVTDRYAATTGATKGILINKAGSTYAATSVLSNSIQKQMDSIDKTVSSLEDILEAEQTRYQNQFTNLETLISQMNSQSSYLSSMTGS